jgi:hypothetical protein
VLGFRVKFTLPRGTGVATSPPSDSLELAVDRAANLESSSKVSILGVVGPDGYVVSLDAACLWPPRTRRSTS